MKHFGYPSILTSFADKSLSGHDIFEKYFKDNRDWLKDHGMEYQVDVFHWPDMPFFTNHQIGKIRTEITIVIDNPTHAAMFRLYTGLPAE